LISLVTPASDAIHALRAATDALRAAGIEDPRVDAEVLLAEASGLDRAALAAGAAVPAPAARRFGEMVRRRLRREPVAYIVGRKGFRRLELAVDRRVLVPRPETELLVEVALEVAPARMLDVGTGSGAIALAVADELPEAEIVATDTSPGALEVARANAARLGLADRVHFLAGTLPRTSPSTSSSPTSPTSPSATGRHCSPRSPNGSQGRRSWPAPTASTPYRALFAECGCLFRSQGTEKTTTVAVEVGQGQAVAVAELVGGAGWSEGRDAAGPGGDRAGRDRAGRRVSEFVSIERDGAEVARSALERQIAAGGVVVFPSDGVYGLACDPLDAAAIGRVHDLKGRDDGKPSAVMYFSPLAFRELVAGLGPRTAAAASALLPGPVTLIVANPPAPLPRWPAARTASGSASA